MRIISFALQKVKVCIKTYNDLQMNSGRLSLLVRRNWMALVPIAIDGIAIGQYKGLGTSQVFSYLFECTFIVIVSISIKPLSHGNNACVSKLF